MTLKERVVCTAFTGINFCPGNDFVSFQKYIETLLGRKVFIDELSKESTWNQIKELSEPEFNRIILDKDNPRIPVVNSMKTFKIYDWRGQEFEYPIKGKIAAINVRVISGDELVYIKYADGTGEHFDAGEDTNRLMDFYDGSYRLTDPDIIERWLNFDPAECKGKYPPEERESYLRYDEFAIRNA